MIDFVMFFITTSQECIVCMHLLGKRVNIFLDPKGNHVQLHISNNLNDPFVLQKNMSIHPKDNYAHVHTSKNRNNHD